MSSRSIFLARSLLHGVKRQQLYYTSIDTVIQARRWLSNSTAPVFVETDSEKPQTKATTPRKELDRQPSKSAPDTDAPPRRKLGKSLSKRNEPEAIAREVAGALEVGENSASKVEPNQTGDELPKKRKRRRKSNDDNTEPDDNTKPKRPRKPSKVALDPFDGLSSPMELQPPDMWTSYYPYKSEWRYRTTIANPQTASSYAEALVPEGSKDKIIIEANAGVGQLSRALLRLPKERIKKLIIIEEAPTFTSTLKPLETVDPRVVVITGSSIQWSTYLDMESHHLLDDVETFPWTEENNQLQFIMSIATDVIGEQFVSQLLRTIPERQWLFKYGRVPMNLLMSTRMWQRVCSPVHTTSRCKVSAIADAVSTFSEALPPKALLPHWEHFYPTRWGQAQTLQMVPCSIVPKAKQIISPGDLEVWDYCMRKMFVLSATPLSGALYTLGVGGTNLLPKLTDPSLPEDQRVDPTKTARDFNTHDWGLIVKAFRAWPFRPTDLSLA